MSVREALAATLASPTASDLWTLRAELLEAGFPENSRAWNVLGEFQEFLNALATGTTSREYSELASKLDVGAVGGVVLEHVLEADDASALAFRLFSGLLSEGLMVLATRQHVKAWEGELAAVHRKAAWYLYEELWCWARKLKPDLPPGERRRLLDRLLAPVHSDETDGFSKAVLLGLLFQMLLLTYVAQESDPA